MAKRGSKAWKANVSKGAKAKVYRCKECGQTYQKKDTRKGGKAYPYCHSK